MSYKTLLVHLDDSDRCKARVNLALELAGRWNAHLIGLYAVCQDLFEPLRRPDEPLKLAVYERLCEQRRKDAEERFLMVAERAGRSVEWQAPAGDVTGTAILHARHADLLVLGQENPDDRMTFVARHFVEDVVMGSGRPAIVVPYAGDVRTLGENVLIGWDGGREAARATADALPLLTRARFVHVETVTRGHPDPDETPAGVDVAAYLERHGIRASFSTTPRERSVSVGAMLLNRVTDVHADLLVMGLYSHARMHERVLGGATRTILETMTVPVLLSH
ncbi:universal stress family protein [Burkholderia ambifaria AMMD]|uniref:UspA domain protein n=1 Tax=Burkholderia ambifaria (strain ATCC BAA-244 / DSM 16087 / CCUG 44356 / LMG 19182 / AMMD) TaxID=339670 RepID=Q0B905_BURCM|nr:universal stress protein [Burkholderia ambifaria]ABI89368.1 UspA domain protein [Burkholderia ambifaria AMMD]AJY24922.1 universal stress family protein [Burkholderia ambifaria AMMD]MBR7930680.1 universal stress protein [Burkholderia ambifaria]PEH67511.1 universal stress protein UspA [Burkholderia ambifaria]QQC07950.1 universal stress protein [Burkholderia ambifaria]